MGLDIMNRPDNPFAFKIKGKQEVKTFEKRQDILTLIKPVDMIDIGRKKLMGTFFLDFFIAHALELSRSFEQV